jgi:MFS family permease
MTNAEQPTTLRPDPAGFDRRLIAPMVLGSVLNPVNSSMVAVALAPIGVAFGAPAAETAWLVSGLYIATAIGQPVVGRLVDTQGPRRLFLAGSTLVGLAGLLGAFAPTLWLLVVSRVLLGFGTCAGYPAAMYLLRSESRRTGQESPAAILTLLSVSTQTIAAIGPTLGGLLIGFGGWHTIFLVNVPLALAALALGALRLPRTRIARGSRAAIDLAGIATFAGTLVALLLFLMRPAVDRWWLPLVAALAAAAFVARELRAADPFIDLRVLTGNGALIRTYARSLLSATVAYSFLYGFTQWLEIGRGLSTSGTGLILLPMSLVGLGVSALTGRRPEVHAKLVVGGVSMVAASALMLLLGPQSPIWLIVVVAALVGVNQGLQNLGNQNALYFQADPARTASSAGLLRTFFYLGAIIAATTNGALLGSGTSDLTAFATFLVVVSVALVVLTVLDRALRHVGVPPGRA